MLTGLEETSSKMSLNDVVHGVRCVHVGFN